MPAVFHAIKSTSDKIHVYSFVHSGIFCFKSALIFSFSVHCYAKVINVFYSCKDLFFCTSCLSDMSIRTIQQSKVTTNT